MILPLLIAIQAAATPSAEDRARYDRCLDLATEQPDAAEKEAVDWRLAGGGYLAQQCLGMAYSNRGNYRGAAETFESAARAAEVAQERLTGNYWTQAANAWAAAGDLGRARSAIDAALAGGLLNGSALGEAYLDRARIRVAQGEPESARADLDQALKLADRDPLAWLLSATLARRLREMPMAVQHINKALELAPDDASVQLEAGNIWAVTGDEEKAKAAWTAAATLGSGKPAGDAATKALSQFEAQP
ncbi:tetratricopeptide repeat protein [Sphingomonas sp. FW199]|uniref:tetratricopeptide repeat protein n=1 Tax=Sphingomonas sp. FW199 TaxID=3400217 RepID=UPI003CF99B6D